LIVDKRQGKISKKTRFRGDGLMSKISNDGRLKDQRLTLWFLKRLFSKMQICFHRLNNENKKSNHIPSPKIPTS